MEKWIFKILLILTLAYLVWGQLFLPKETDSGTSECYEFNEDWQWVKESGQRKDVELPAALEVEKGKTAVLVNTLPAVIQNNTYLLFQSKRQDVRFLVDGVLRSEYSTKNTRLLGNTSSVYYMYVRLMPEDSRKEIRMELSSASRYSGMVGEISIGDRLSLNRVLMREDIASLVVAMIMFIVGLVVVIVCLILEKTFGDHMPLEDLGWGIIVLTAWFIIGSSFRQFMFHNLSTASDVTFILVMLLPFPFLMYMNQLQRGRYRLAYMIMEVLTVVDALGSLAMVILEVQDFSETIYMNLVNVGLAGAVILTTTLIDTFTDKVREYLFPAIGMVGIMGSGIVYSFFYIRRSSNVIGSLVISIGLLFMLAMAIAYTVQELMRMNRDKSNALQSSRAQSQFLASMSHEIRTPINAVLGMDEMILRESGQQEILEYAADIQNAGKSLLTIINDILDFSKVQSGRMELVPVEYSLSEMIRDCCNMVAVRAEEKGLTLTVKNNPDLPEKLWGDEVRIRQIVVNFLTNAVKYTEKGGVTLIVDGDPPELPASKELWVLKFSVRDTGIGVREEDVPHLFDAFTRMDMTKNRNVEGSGLGLALSDNLARLMKGRIDVESVYGQGSTFILTVQQKAVGRGKIGEFRLEDSPSRVVEHREEHVYLPGARILVVDDVTVNLKVFTNLLKNSGMIIDTADSGEECISRVQENRYDLIFLDHMMPVMNGMEVMKRIRQMEFGPNVNTPVIMLTANAIMGARESYLEAGFADYLSKPIQIDALEEMLVKYIKM